MNITRKMARQLIDTFDELLASPYIDRPDVKTIFKTLIDELDTAQGDAGEDGNVEEIIIQVSPGQM